MRHLETTGDLIRLHSECLARGWGPRGIPVDIMGQISDNRYRMYFQSANPASAQYKWLHAAVSILRPKLVIEFGRERGLSGLALWAALRHLPIYKLISVDTEIGGDYFANAMIDDRNFQRVLGSSLGRDCMRQVQRFRWKDPDIVFLDTTHDYAQVGGEITTWQDTWYPGTLVIIDDIHLGDLGVLWGELPWPKLNISNDVHETGYGIAIFNGRQFRPRRRVLRQNSFEREYRGRF